MGKQNEMEARLTEFKALRDVIDRKRSSQYTILAFTVSASAVLLGLILVNGQYALILAIPPFFLLSELLYLNILSGLGAVARYILEEIEPKTPGLGWQRYIKERASPSIFQYVIHFIFVLPVVGSIVMYYLLSWLQVIKLPMELHYLSSAAAVFYIAILVFILYWFSKIRKSQPFPIQ